MTDLNEKALEAARDALRACNGDTFAAVRAAITAYLAVCEPGPVAVPTREKARPGGPLHVALWDAISDFARNWVSETSANTPRFEMAIELAHARGALQKAVVRVEDALLAYVAACEPGPVAVPTRDELVVAPKLPTHAELARKLGEAIPPHVLRTLSYNGLATIVLQLLHEPAARSQPAPSSVTAGELELAEAKQRAEAAEARCKELGAELAEARDLSEQMMGERNGLQEDIEAEQKGRLDLRERFGARDDETFGAFIVRILASAERTEARAKELEAELAEARAAHLESQENGARVSLELSGAREQLAAYSELETVRGWREEADRANRELAEAREALAKIKRAYYSGEGGDLDEALYAVSSEGGMLTPEWKALATGETERSLLQRAEAAEALLRLAEEAATRAESRAADLHGRLDAYRMQCDTDTRLLDSRAREIDDLQGGLERLRMACTWDYERRGEWGYTLREAIEHVEGLRYGALTHFLKRIEAAVSAIAEQKPAEARPNTLGEAIDKAREAFTDAEGAREALMELVSQPSRVDTVVTSLLDQGISADTARAAVRDAVETGRVSFDREMKLVVAEPPREPSGNQGESLDISRHIAKWLRRHGWALEGEEETLVACLKTAMAVWRKQAPMDEFAQQHELSEIRAADRPAPASLEKLSARVDALSRQLFELEGIVSGFPHTDYGIEGAVKDLRAQVERHEKALRELVGCLDASTMRPRAIAQMVLAELDRGKEKP
jgi:hypothetical protein